MSYDSPLQRDGGEENLFFDMADDLPNPEQQILDSSFSEDLQRALNSLSPEQRLLVTLADVEGVPAWSRPWSGSSSPIRSVSGVRPRRVIRIRTRTSSALARAIQHGISPYAS